jgi:hypothetical protein
MAYDIPTRFHKVLSRHLREIEQTKMCGRIRIIVKKKRRIAIHHLTEVRGDIIIITRYDYNLTKSSKPATDNRFKK